MRNKLITDKVQALQQELETWATKQGLLEPGERIIFTMRIEKASLVAYMDIDQLYSMEAREFFSISRICSFGATHQLAARIAHYIMDETCCYSRGEIERCKSMREFLAENPSSAHLLRIPNLGRICVKQMMHMMRECGLIREDFE